MDLLLVYKLRPPYMKCIQYQQVNPPETPIPDYSNVQLLENITQSVKKDDFSPPQHIQATQQSIPAKYTIISPWTTTRYFLVKREPTTRG